MTGGVSKLRLMIGIISNPRVTITNINWQGIGILQNDNGSYSVQKTQLTYKTKDTTTRKTMKTMGLWSGVLL